MKKFFSFLLIVPLAFASFVPALQAQPIADKVQVHFFEREDCSHCQDQDAFLKDLSQQRDDFEIVYHDIYIDEQKELFIEVAETKDLPKVTPLTIIGGHVIQGFSTAETTGKRLVELIEDSKGEPQYNMRQILENNLLKDLEQGGETCDETEGCAVNNNLIIDVPFIGTVDMGKYSLPALALSLGFVDGFNPCAMWVLVMFLTILAEVGSRKRMFEVAGLFLLAEAIMYYLILNVWMTTWDFIGLDRFVTPIVGIVALGAGLYFLYLFSIDDQTCKVGSLEQKRKTQEKMRDLAHNPMTFVTAGSILLLAFSVNIIEFACSIGIPQTFTKVLDINYLSFAAKQFYNFLYILMYMVDDLIVFAIAIYSFDRIGLTTQKYTKASHLIGGVIMVVLGLIFLMDPTLLTFR